MTKPNSTGGPRARPMRADARRNYERLLTAARAVYAEHGLDASLDDIARRAGVGNATLYRHFSTREALLDAVHQDEIEALCTAAEQLGTESEPGAALTIWLRSLIGQGSTSRGLLAALTAALSMGGSDMSWCREAIITAATTLLSRAQRAGVVRADITAAQLLKLVNAIAFVTERDPDNATRADQLLTLMMEGIYPRNPAPTDP
ncbi:TetR/AcrR family transcriptional regulator [Nocardia sp. NPDC004278]